MAESVRRHHRGSIVALYAIRKKGSSGRKTAQHVRRTTTLNTSFLPPLTHFFQTQTRQFSVSHTYICRIGGDRIYDLSAWEAPWLYSQIASAVKYLLVCETPTEYRNLPSLGLQKIATCRGLGQCGFATLGVASSLTHVGILGGRTRCMGANS